MMFVSSGFASAETTPYYAKAVLKKGKNGIDQSKVIEVQKDNELLLWVSNDKKSKEIVNFYLYNQNSRDLIESGKVQPGMEEKRNIERSDKYYIRLECGEDGSKKACNTRAEIGAFRTSKVSTINENGRIELTKLYSPQGGMEYPLSEKLRRLLSRELRHLLDKIEHSKNRTMLVKEKIRSNNTKYTVKIALEKNQTRVE
jgi:hypothetical protein